MERTARELVRHAQQLARDSDARAVVLYADAMTGFDEISGLVRAVDFPTILVTAPARRHRRVMAVHPSGSACPTYP